MKIIRRNSLFPVFNSMFDDNLVKDVFDMPEAMQVPAVNIKEEEKSFEIELASPGMKKEDFNVAVDNNMLTISTEKSEENEEKTDTYTRREFNYASFSRSFTLPEKEVDINKIDAKYEAGVLHITVPKKKKVETKKLVAVN